MITFQSLIGASAMVAAITFAQTATAQVRSSRQPVPRQALPVQPQLPSAPAARPPTQPLRQRMPAPGSDGTPVSTIRINPVTVYAVGDRPDSKDTNEGQVLMFYAHGKLESERIVDSRVVGRYLYDQNGRFERIEYDDGIIITAQYAGDEELRSLTSSNGRTIAFAYREAADKSIGKVTPTNENNLLFHSALAILRMKDVPFYWRGQSAMSSAQTGTEEVDTQNEDGTNPGKTDKYPGDRYPGDAMPKWPKAPDPDDGEMIASVPVSAPKLPAGDDIPVGYVPLVNSGGIDFIPPRGGLRRLPDLPLPTPEDIVPAPEDTY